VKKILILFTGVFRLSVFANDGFYQGSGQDLVPIKNTNLRVISERLEISPLEKPKCYDAIFAKSEYDKKGILKDQAKGPRLIQDDCDKLTAKTNNDFAFLTTKWHAKAIYKVEVLKTQNDVQTGFPIPQWNMDWQGEDGLLGTKIPGAMNFKTTMNGKIISSLQIKNVEVPNIFDEHKIQNTPAYIWKLDFKQGTPYELTAEYDFGIDYSNDYYENRELPKTAKTWFQHKGAESILYYLHPLKLWNATPPTEIKLILKNMKNIPTEYWTFITKADYCVDKDFVQLSWRNALPQNDLHATYPLKVETKPFTKKDEVLTWLNMMKLIHDHGRPLQVTCAFTKDLEKFSSDSTIEALIEVCVKSCE
jgi:hypothetical protein